MQNAAFFSMHQCAENIVLECQIHRKGNDKIRHVPVETDQYGKSIFDSIDDHTLSMLVKNSPTDPNDPGDDGLTQPAQYHLVLILTPSAAQSMPPMPHPFSAQHQPVSAFLLLPHIHLHLQPEKGSG